MINKESFIKIVDTLDAYFNGEVYEAMKTLGLTEGVFDAYMDNIIEALEVDIDPAKLARNDDYCYDCGSYINEWLFGAGEFQEKCKSAADLFDYICTAYSNLTKENAKS